MTTNVTVKTHDWPVAITSTDWNADGPVTATETVEPHSERTVYMTQTRSLEFRELPKPDANG